MAETRNSLAGHCGYCGAVLEAKTSRRRYCGDPCRWAAWKRQREEAARAPVERALRDLLVKVDEAVEEAREVLANVDHEER